jgi:cysteinyl-tRNA synthetase
MLKLYNSLSRSIEEFVPIYKPIGEDGVAIVGMYTCGPTVYLFQHIGNFRSFTTADLLNRVLKHDGYEVKFVMNITDVGHLTSDADTGEDKLEKSAKKEGKSVWEIAEFYTDIFLKDYKALDLTQPEVLAKATDHIHEQIELVRVLEEKGYTYQTSDGIYFDTSRFKKYGELSDMDQIKEGARVEVNSEKRNPRDFVLWKFSPKDEQRQMEWWFEGPLSGKLVKETDFRKVDAKYKETIGFPGWHIECSAMSMKYLGEHFDIHTGGIDHKEIHHPDEIAQSEAATGKKFVNYWVHTAFMLIEGQKMSKSLGNIYRLYDLEKEGYDPLALRYLYVQTHYRQEMNFTFSALEAAQNAWKKLIAEAAKLEEPAGNLPEFEAKFDEAINDDLNMPKALAVVWEMLKSDSPSGAKAKTLFKFDEILGLQLRERSLARKKEFGMVPRFIKDLIKERNDLRAVRKFSAADQIRAKIEKAGYEIEDTKKGTKVWKK